MAQNFSIWFFHRFKNNIAYCLGADYDGRVAKGPMASPKFLFYRRCFLITILHTFARKIDKLTQTIISSGYMYLGLLGREPCKALVKVVPRD